MIFKSIKCFSAAQVEKLSHSKGTVSQYPLNCGLAEVYDVYVWAAAIIYRDMKYLVASRQNWNSVVPSRFTWQNRDLCCTSRRNKPRTPILSTAFVKQGLGKRKSTQDDGSEYKCFRPAQLGEFKAQQRIRLSSTVWTKFMYVYVWAAHLFTDMKYLNL